MNDSATKDIFVRHWCIADCGVLYQHKKLFACVQIAVKNVLTTVKSLVNRIWYKAKIPHHTETEVKPRMISSYLVP